MTLMLLVAPLAMAGLVWIVRRARLLALPISAAGCAAYGLLVLGARRVAPTFLLGRALSLSPRDSTQLCIVALSFAVMLIYACRLPQGDMAGPLALITLGLFGATMMVRGPLIASILLAGGAVAAVMLAPGSRPGASTAASRALTLLVMACTLLMLAATAMESTGAADGLAPSAMLGAVACVVALSMLLAAFPFFIWLPPTFERAGPLAAVALGIGLSSTAIVRFSDLQQWAEPLVQLSMADMLLTVGLVTTVVASVAAAVQTGVSRALAYAAIADMGLVLVGLGLRGQQESGAAMLHLALRSVAILITAMSAGVLRHCFGSDEREAIQGAAQRAPFAVLGLAVGGLALVGIPPGAGFASRFGLYQATAQRLPLWAVTLTMCSLGPAWALGRSVVATLGPLPLAGSRREPLLPAMLIALISLALLALGLMPQLLAALPPQWFDILAPLGSAP